MAQAVGDELIEEWLQGHRSPQDLLGADGLVRELNKRLLERALGAELSEQLGYEKATRPAAAAATAIRARRCWARMGRWRSPRHTTAREASSRRSWPRIKPGSTASVPRLDPGIRSSACMPAACMPADCRFARS